MIFSISFLKMSADGFLLKSSFQSAYSLYLKITFIYITRLQNIRIVTINEKTTFDENEFNDFISYPISDLIYNRLCRLLWQYAKNII